MVRSSGQTSAGEPIHLQSAPSKQGGTGDDPALGVEYSCAWRCGRHFKGVPNRRNEKRRHETQFCPNKTTLTYLEYVNTQLSKQERKVAKRDEITELIATVEAAQGALTPQPAAASTPTLIRRREQLLREQVSLGPTQPYFICMRVPMRMRVRACVRACVRMRARTW